MWIFQITQKLQAYDIRMVNLQKGLFLVMKMYQLVLLENLFLPHYFKSINLSSILKFYQFNPSECSVTKSRQNLEIVFLQLSENLLIFLSKLHKYMKQIQYSLVQQQNIYWRNFYIQSPNNQLRLDLMIENSVHNLDWTASQACSRQNQILRLITEKGKQATFENDLHNQLFKQKWREIAKSMSKLIIMPLMHKINQRTKSAHNNSKTFLIAKFQKDIRKLIMHGHQSEMKTCMIKLLFQISSDIVNNLLDHFAIPKSDHTTNILGAKQPQSMLNEDFKISSNQEHFGQQNIFLGKQNSYPMLNQLAEYINKVQPNLQIFSTLFQDISSRHQTKFRFFKALQTQIINNNLILKKISDQFHDVITIIRTPLSKQQQQLKNEKLFQIIKTVHKIGLFELLESEFIQRSKSYYIEAGSQIPKTIQIFSVINEYIKNQEAICKILRPSQSTVYFAQKQLVQENYYGMLEYFDYMIQIQRNQTILIKQQARFARELKLLWSFTKRLGVEDQIEQRLKLVISDFKKYLTPDSQGACQLMKIPVLMKHLKRIIKQYFNNQRRMHSAVHETIENIVSNEESVFNKLLIHLLFQQAAHSQASFEYIYELFKLTSNKVYFIAQFRKQLTAFVVLHSRFNCTFDQKTKYATPNNPSTVLRILKFLQKFTTLMSKQCGQKNCQDICSMIADVFNGQNIVEHQFRNLKCYMLGSYWFTYSQNKSMTLIDQLNEVKEQFISRYQAQHAPTTGLRFQWCHELNFVEISFFGFNCRVSETQACILLRLQKSIRPMTIEQLAETVLVSCETIQQSLFLLEQEKMISSIKSKQRGSVFELNSQFPNLEKCQKFKVQSKPNQYIYCYMLSLGRLNTLIYKDEQESEINRNKDKKASGVMRDYSAIVQGGVIRVLKNRKSMQKTQLSDLVVRTIKIFRPTLQQITEAIQILENKQQIEIDKKKGIIKYIQ